MSNKKTAKDYPIILVDGEVYHVCPLEDQGFVLLSPEEFDSRWWDFNPYVDTHVNKDAEPPKKLELPTE